VDLKTLLAQPNGKEQLVYFLVKSNGRQQITDDGEVMAQARRGVEVRNNVGISSAAGNEAYAPCALALCAFALMERKQSRLFAPRSNDCGHRSRNILPL
jgi:hypothetical protein